MAKPKPATYQVVITVKSADGSKPITRVLGGDTIFTWLAEGQTARIATKRLKSAVKAMKHV